MLVQQLSFLFWETLVTPWLSSAPQLQPGLRLLCALSRQGAKSPCQAFCGVFADFLPKKRHCIRVFTLSQCLIIISVYDFN